MYAFPSLTLCLNWGSDLYLNSTLKNKRLRLMQHQFYQQCANTSYYANFFILSDLAHETCAVKSKISVMSLVFGNFYFDYILQLQVWVRV